MRLSDLMGVAVHDGEGEKVGRVTDVRFERATPVVPTTGQPRWRLTGLIVGGGGFAHRLGYVQDEVSGPWLLEALIRRLARRGRFVPWGSIRAIDDSAIVIDAALEQLDPADGSPAP